MAFSSVSCLQLQALECNSIHHPEGHTRNTYQNLPYLYPPWLSITIMESKFLKWLTLSISPTSCPTILKHIYDAQPNRPLFCPLRDLNFIFFSDTLLSQVLQYLDSSHLGPSSSIMTSAKASLNTYINSNFLSYPLFSISPFLTGRNYLMYVFLYESPTRMLQRVNAWISLNPYGSPGASCLEEHQVNAAAAKSLQLCPTLCNPIDGSPPGSAVPGILQARILEWVAISFYNAR